MPWSPFKVDVARNADLDGFRGSAAEVFDEGQVIATLFFEVEPVWARVGGHLWWRRWSLGVEMVYGYWTPTQSGVMGDDWVSDPRDKVSRIFLQDLRAGHYVERDYDDPRTPVTCEYKIRWLAEPERTAARRACGFEVD